MSMSNKYSGCGCSAGTTKSYSSDLQSAPSACCEAHNTTTLLGMCLKPTCTVVASTEPFFLKFSNVVDPLPIDGNFVFFYHPAAGLMRVVGVDAYGAYQVSLEDPSKAGGNIEKDSCVLISVQNAAASTSNARCLCGKFTAPAINDNQTIYIENGASIPVGSTLTFTANGETGSYVVSAFVSASGSTYAYDIQNTGNGHTPGTIIDGGVTGACIVPIELITSIDLCNLSSTVVADTISACTNGSPRGLNSTGENDILVGDGNGGWEISKLAGTDCCLVINDCLKFSGNTCPSGEDTVLIQDVSISCFEEAWNAVLASEPNNTGQTNMPMNIDGFNVVVTGYDAGNGTVTVQAVDDVPAEGLSYPSGTQICLGECCRSCLGGPKSTSYRVLPSEANDYAGSVFAFNTVGQLEYEPGVKHRYLVGYEFGTTPPTAVVLELDATFDDDPQGGPGKPVISDPILYRNKLCNNSEKGCDQNVDLLWNFELGFDSIPQGVRVHWELGHYANNSDTIADGTTPNPFGSVSTSAAAAGYIDGPSSLDAQTIIGQTSIGLGGSGNEKIFPIASGAIFDYVYLERCNCVLSILWFYVETEVLTGGPVSGDTFNSTLNVRQRIIYSDSNEAPLPPNDVNSEGFA